jgi:hypothetical protein
MDENEAWDQLRRQSGWRKRQIVDKQEEAIKQYEREELIKQTAKKCAEIADMAEPYKSADLIRKHFGVEE